MSNWHVLALLRSRRVDRDVTSVPNMAMQAFDGRFGAFQCGHGDESEGARPAGRSFDGESDFGDGALLGE